MGLNKKAWLCHGISPDNFNQRYGDIRKLGHDNRMEKQFNLRFGGTWSSECRMMFPWNTCNFPTQLKKSEE